MSPSSRPGSHSENQLTPLHLRTGLRTTRYMVIFVFVLVIVLVLLPSYWCCLFRIRTVIFHACCCFSLHFSVMTLHTLVLSFFLQWCLALIMLVCYFPNASPSFFLHGFHSFCTNSLFFLCNVRHFLHWFNIFFAHVFNSSHIRAITILAPVLPIPSC